MRHTRLRIGQKQRRLSGLGSASSDMEVAKIILEQLGKRALWMMGASSFVAGMFKNGDKEFPGVRFKIKGSKVSYIRIVLNGSDLYNVAFINRAGNEVQFVEGIYAEDLHRLIEGETGLYLSL